jgi:hypothetical protein
MATTASFSTNSPYTLTALISSDTGVAVSIARAAVLAAASAGPLKALLTRTADWTVFNAGGTHYAEIHVRELINRDSDRQAETLEVFWEATGLKINCDSGGTEQVEIRLQHTERF